jgi:hypothetical protein
MGVSEELDFLLKTGEAVDAGVPDVDDGEVWLRD